jgi:hypothetical protein
MVVAKAPESQFGDFTRSLTVDKPCLEEGGQLLQDVQVDDDLLAHVQQLEEVVVVDDSLREPEEELPLDTDSQFVMSSICLIFVIKLPHFCHQITSFLSSNYLILSSIYLVLSSN